MELQKLKKEELRGYDLAKLKETEKDVRRQLHEVRMDIYSTQGKHTGKIRGLRKTLARIMTLQHASKAGVPAVSAKRATTAKKTVATKK